MEKPKRRNIVQIIIEICDEMINLATQLAKLQDELFGAETARGVARRMAEKAKKVDERNEWYARFGTITGEICILAAHRLDTIRAMEKWLDKLQKIMHERYNKRLGELEDRIIMIEKVLGALMSESDSIGPTAIRFIFWQLGEEKGVGKSIEHVSAYLSNQFAVDGIWEIRRTPYDDKADWDSLTAPWPRIRRKRFAEIDDLFEKVAHNQPILLVLDLIILTRRLRYKCIQCGTLSATLPQADGIPECSSCGAKGKEAFTRVVDTSL